MQYEISFVIGNHPDSFLTKDLGKALFKLMNLSQFVAPVTHVTSKRMK